MLTTNTSSLSVAEMASALKYPERFAGLHFFNPVHRMPLVEIITHEGVSEQTVKDLYRWCLFAKKTPVVVKDGPGFLVNRILMPYLNEAVFLLEEGVSMQAIEQACLNFGMPMGPFRLLDEVGLDVALKVSKILHEGLGERARSGTFNARVVEQEFLGKKSGKGFYRYQDGEEVENPAIKVLLPSQGKKLDEGTIQKRIFLPMINEAAYILQEKIVDVPEQVDLGLIFGTGFPPFRGGLLRYADSEGLEKVAKDLDHLAQDVDSERYKACSYLRERKSFYG